jgi:hypothetical protein
MSLLYSSRRNGTQMLLKALVQPTSSAAMPSPAAGSTTSLPETILGPADAHTHRRWSHYAASTSQPSIFGQSHRQSRAFSAASSSGSSKGGAAHAPPPPPPSFSSSTQFPRRPIQKTADGDDPNPLPPGAALKRAAHALDTLNSEPELPPWQAVSQERLSRELLEYRNDLASAKRSVTAARKSSNKPSLPFIGEAVSSIVDAERAALASPSSNLYDSSGGGKGLKNNHVQNMSARSLNKRLGFAQLRAVLDMVPGQDGQRSTSSQLYDQMWNIPEPPSPSTAAAATAAANEQQADSFDKQQQQQQEPEVKPVGGDEAQSLLAAKANKIISVLTTIEFLLPLTPWQRRAVSRAVVESMHTESDDEEDVIVDSDAGNRISSSSRSRSYITNKKSTPSKGSITAHSARAAVLFLLTDCGLTHRQASHAICEHPWLLGIENIRTRCSGLLEGLYLLDMDLPAVATVIAAHPPALLMNADTHIIPLLEYINGLGFSEKDAAELIRAAPKLLLDPIAKQRLAGSVAFWIGQGMSRPSLRSLLTAAPEVTSMSLRLLQLKTEWLMEQAGFSIEDLSLVPAAIQFPLAAHVAPRLAFARHRGYTVDPPSKQTREGFFSSWSTSKSKSLQIESLLSSPEVDFLNSVGNATDAEFRAFEAAWRDSDLRIWFKSRISGPSVTQYEGMEWLAEEEMGPLREMHDHHVALREIAWEQQQDREKEWETVWGDWKRAQSRRDQLETWTKRMKKRREDEAMRRAMVEMTMLAESQGVRRPGMCLKSPYCNRKINHPGTCNQKLALKMNFNLDEYTNTSSAAADGIAGVDGGGIAKSEELASFDDEFFKRTIGDSLGGGGGRGTRGQTVHEVATVSEVDAGLYLFGEIKSDVPANETELDEDSISISMLSITDIGGDSANYSTIEPGSIATSSTGILKNSEGYLVLGDGPTLSKEEIESQDIDLVLECFSGLEALLERAPHGVLSHRTVNAWADRQGYSRAVSTAAKGVLAATGTARVVVEPNFQYHKVVPKAWQLLNSTTTSGGGAAASREPPVRLTRSATNVAVLSNLVIKMLDSLPDGMIQRKDLRSWAEQRWKGSSKLHLRAVVAGLLEQGVVVQRRRKGISSGPMEVAQIDLKRYLTGLSEQFSAGLRLAEEESEGGSGASVTASALGANNDTTKNNVLSENASSTTNNTTTITYINDDFQSRSALTRRVRFTDDDWTRFENLPPDQVRSCADRMLDLLKSMPEMSVSHRTLASWAAQQGYDKETVIAAKGVLFAEGSATVYIQQKESGTDGSSTPQKMWVATKSKVDTSDTTEEALPPPEAVQQQDQIVPLQPMLKAVRESRGGFITKGELRTWAKTYKGNNWKGVGALNIAIATLLESGCLMQLSALPAVDGKKSKLLVAIDLRQYLNYEEQEKQDDGGYTTD